ncbi:hypothetical protein TrCOL_g8040 [Triparma columacea]|uniref:N(6)-L-threonylcarbamoyladenine synthase n=1 Tax=Triparma columacea TaxID=722753 RepID=A0A9W7FZP5_9STRA|nr:hypothetical protein TrCOL_g8040 [Triparma columacea]
MLSLSHQIATLSYRTSYRRAYRTPYRTAHRISRNERLHSSNTALFTSKKERRDNIGRAKAVDRGQYNNSYVHTPNRPLSGLPPLTSPYTVLGIETSCDDTGVAIVRSDGVILGEALASQVDVHEGYGGVVPGLARQAHEANIQPTIEAALSRAEMSAEDVDGVAVTVGPGLEICLRVGCEVAKEIAVKHGKPFVAVHHLEAHILMSRLGTGGVDFPFLALLVSGGHCQILRCEAVGEYEVIGGTLDDSLGEAYDKVARMLGLPVGGGGGPAVEKLALKGDHTKIKLPIPMQHRKDCDFSFAGLKNAFRMAVSKLKDFREIPQSEELELQDKADLAASFQHAAVKHLEQRISRAIVGTTTSTSPTATPINQLVVVGGCASNQAIRSSLSSVCSSHGWKMYAPEARLCTDNGVMAAWAGVLKFNDRTSDKPEGQEVYARYPFASYKKL